MVAVILDVKGAFPNVLPGILVDKIANVGGSPQLIKFVQSSTSYRHIFSDSNLNDARLLFKGLVQGGVMSPTLYDICSNSITEKLPDDAVC